MSHNMSPRTDWHPWKYCSTPSHTSNEMIKLEECCCRMTKLKSWSYNSKIWVIVKLIEKYSVGKLYFSLHITLRMRLVRNLKFNFFPMYTYRWNASLGRMRTISFIFLSTKCSWLASMIGVATLTSISKQINRKRRTIDEGESYTGIFYNVLQWFKKCASKLSLGYL